MTPLQVARLGVPKMTLRRRRSRERHRPPERSAERPPEHPPEQHQEHREHQEHQERRERPESPPSPRSPPRRRRYSSPGSQLGAFASLNPQTQQRLIIFLLAGAIVALAV